MHGGAVSHGGPVSQPRLPQVRDMCEVVLVMAHHPPFLDELAIIRPAG